jgi:hypothetical protein
MFREPRNLLPKAFIDHRIEVRESPIHGWGCFAKENIEAHTLIESAPVVLCHQDVMEHLHALNDCRHILQDYPFSWKDGMLAYSLGWGAVYNHKRDNNCVWRPNFEYNTLEYTTKRKILAEEEIFVRYVPVAQSGYLWFEEEDEEDVNYAALRKPSKNLIF